MEWEVHSAWDVLSDPESSLGHEWDAINSEHFDCHPLLSIAFVSPLIKHFAGPDVLLAISNDHGLGRSLVLLRPKEIGLWCTFLPSQAPIAPALLLQDASVADLIGALPGFALGVDFLCQDPLCSNLIDRSPGEGSERTRHVTTTSVDLTTSFEEYWSARPVKMRQNMRRYFKRLAERGYHPTLRVWTSAEDTRPGLHRYGILESAGWKGAAGSAIHPDNLQGRFYADVMEGFGKRAAFRVYELYIGEQLVASRLCVSNKSILVMLKTTYDEAFSELAPGRLLLYMVLEREFSRSEFCRVEFYTNANADSLAWSTSTRDIFHISHYRFAAVRRLIAWSRPLRQALKAKRASGRAKSSEVAASNESG